MGDHTIGAGAIDTATRHHIYIYIYMYTYTCISSTYKRHVFIHMHVLYVDIYIHADMQIYVQIHVGVCLFD